MTGIWHVPDIYFDGRYPLLYEKLEDGKACTIAVNNEHGSVISRVILRKIPIDIGRQYYDLVTPYGYGGPMITSLTGDRDALVRSFYEEMLKFTKENMVVSEFVRFHPVLGNGIDFKTIYNSQLDRKTVGTNVADYEIDEEFSKSARKYIRRALKAGITYEIVKNPKEVNEFKEVYYSTMDRDQAEEFYYFDDAYFDQCLKTLGEHILYVKVKLGQKVIAAGFYFVYGDIIECHLSGTLTEYISFSPAYVTKLATALWAKENHIRFIHYGGGTSRNPENSLYQFKKKFGQHTEFDFYIGKKVWNEKAYAELCEVKHADMQTDYFPAYRRPGNV